MYRVSKVLNNNGVIAINMEENIEYVLLGKGIGFGKKISQRFQAFLRNIWRSQMKFCKKQR